MLYSFITSALFSLGTKATLKLAERYQFLPAKVYHRMALDKLKESRLDEAAHYNRITLTKKPDFDKAQVIRDLITMRRDSALSRLDQRINENRYKIQELKNRQKSKNHQRIRLILTRLWTIISIVLFAASVFSFFLFLYMYAQGRLTVPYTRLLLALLAVFIFGPVFVRAKQNFLSDAMLKQDIEATLQYIKNELNRLNRQLAILEKRRQELEQL